MSFLSRIFKSEEEKLMKKLSPTVDKVFALENELKSLSDEDLKKRSLDLKHKVIFEIKTEEDILTLKDLEDRDFKKQSRRIIDAILENNIAEAFALVREAARRSLGIMHYRVQVLGGMMMNKGYIAEMRTGEGKTLVATLPAYLNALAGKGVHIITVNDYLSKRDAVWMGKIYDTLGLSVSVLNHQSSYLYDREIVNKKDHEKAVADDKVVEELGSFKIEDEYLRKISRKEAYQADITYGTNSEFGFDYLKDNLVYNINDLLQREHHFAIVDEVDSILIDESRTPLIISAPATDVNDIYKRFANFADKLIEGVDYTKDEKDKAISITNAGIEKAEKEFSVNSLYSTENIKLVHHLETAVRAKALFISEKQYVVRDVKNDFGFSKKEVVIVDEFTGRMQPGRRWSDGLHQAVEAKEGVEVQEESKTIASITYQNFFRFYKKLTGMSGTAKTNEEEFLSVYGLAVAVIPTNKKIARIDKPDFIFQTEKGKLKALAREVKSLHEKGQPVLIGTISIEKNEVVSKYLERENIPHNVLNAKNHEKEGEIIANAGKKFAVTIATNLAGRGVDIKLGGPEATKEQREEINNLGGLFVLGTERHEARRIDNQLRGRSGRQGDNGATQFFVSLEDDLMRIFGGDSVKKMMGKLGIQEDMPITSSIVSRILENSQSKIEGLHFDSRKHTLEYDDVLNHQRQAIYSRRKKFLLKNTKELENILEELYIIKSDLRDFITEKSLKYTKEYLYDVLCTIYIQIIDQFFMAHLEHMESLRQSVNLRAYGQRDPLVEYKKEALFTYKAMIDKIKEEYYNFILHIDNVMANLESNRIIQETQAKKNIIIENRNENEMLGEVTGEDNENNNQKIGRNDACPCGSGKKVKKCSCLEYGILRK